jgi:AcrR family transcriptional regulator
VIEEADPKILEAAEKLFKARGFHAVVLADVARESGVALPAVQLDFPDTASLLRKLLDKHSPRQEIELALRQLRTDSPETLVRTAVEKFVTILNAHARFVELAVIDVQVNEGAYLAELFGEIAGEAASFINRLSTMHGTRPISSIMLGRVFASLLIGFIATQQLAPQSARYAMRVYPSKAWIEGLSDIFLYGILAHE